MRRSALVTGVLLVAACGGSDDRRRDTQVYDVADQTAAAESMDANMSGVEARRAPGIGVSAAPGVAFNYRYAFRLPSNRISGAQERHAQMCEKLGLARCRITGMRYRLENERDISAMLALKLDPAVARLFGKQATAVITGSEGMLVDQEISGIDVAATIADPGATATAIGAARAALASTPMMFNYGSGNLIPGFDTASPIRDALTGANRLFVGAIATIITILAAVLPWALLLALGLWIVRRFVPGWPRQPRGPTSVYASDEGAVA